MEVEITASAEQKGILLQGASREFRGEQTEGTRADELNEKTGYAYNAVTSEAIREQNHEETVKWLSANDWTKAITRVLYDQKDTAQTMNGHVTLIKDAEDVKIRAQRVKKLAQKQRIKMEKDTPVWEMNFDAPWHEGQAYVDLVVGGTRQTLTELFYHDPNACVMMYVEHGDYFFDGTALKALGAKSIGKDTYLNAPKTRQERQKDSVFFLNKASFEASKFQPMPKVKG